MVTLRLSENGIRYEDATWEQLDTLDDALGAAEGYVYECGYVYAGVLVDGEIYAEYES